MKELEFLKIIKDTLTNSHHLGDDCAYLKDLGIFITQDSLVEDVHFSLDTISPYQLGRKSVAVNLSDIAASISEPKYILISLSLPPHITEDFVNEFYKGVNDICNEFGVIVAGGDITGSEKIFISVVAIGKKISEYVSSRAYAEEGDIVIITGDSGSSSCALFCLKNNIDVKQEIIEKHLNPAPKVIFSEILAKTSTKNLAVMDTSDGLVDALYKISEASKCKIEIELERIPFDKDIEIIAKKHGKNHMDWVLWGGEDYEIVACIKEDLIEKLDKDSFKIIGRVTGSNETGEVILKSKSSEIKITKEIFENKSFNHFERDK